MEFDEKGREVLSQIPVAFNVPVQRRISTLDFHRQRIIEERQRLREMLEAMQADAEVETFAEANDFNVDDPLDPEAATSEFELDDDVIDPALALAEKEYRAAAAKSGESSSPKEEGVTGNNNGNPS